MRRPYQLSKIGKEERKSGLFRFSGRNQRQFRGAIRPLLAGGEVDRAAAPGGAR
jgi:hypothetical protein